MRDQFGCCRWVWNWALAKKTQAWEDSKENISCFDLMGQLTNLKQADETIWLSAVAAQPLQSTIRNLDKAFTAFFRKNNGYPRFKNKRTTQSFLCPQKCSINFDSKTLNVPKIKGIKFRDDRSFTQDLKTITIFKTPSGRYFARIVIDDDREFAPILPVTEKGTIGVDLGITHFATLSTGEKIANPRFFKKASKRLRRAHRRLSKAQFDGKNREKRRIARAKAEEKVANQRKDFQHKLSSRLVRENQAIAIETLDLMEMMRTQPANIRRGIKDCAWGSFLLMLEYKAKRSGRTILKIGKYEPSSKRCSCGIVNRRLQLQDRKWTCKSCGESHDRDVLAAQNIKSMALHPNHFVPQEMRERITPREIPVTGSLN